VRFHVFSLSNLDFFARRLTTVSEYRIHCLHHSTLGGEIHLDAWAAARGCSWTSSIVPEAESLPGPEEVDCLAVMGGPMSVWEEREHPWLRAEKRLLERYIAAGRPVLGVCLGAQLLAEVLGARTYPGPHLEVGWHPLRATAESQDHPLGRLLPEQFETFLWHGDTFDLPHGALHLAASEAFPNQAFLYERALALQFHLEVRPDWVQRIAARDAGQLPEGDFVQPLRSVLGKPESLYRANNQLLERLLDRWLVGVE